MNVFDLLFLASVLASVITLIAAAISALRGRGAKALRILRIYGMCALTYFAIALAVDFVKPQRVIAVGEPWCFDDWCLQVENIDHAPTGSKVSYVAQLRIYSTARGISQRALGAWIYLIDERGRRYPANRDPAATPLTVELGPGQSVTTERVFEVPADARVAGLITGHGGAYCGWSLFIIGEGGCLLNRPTMVRIP